MAGSPAPESAQQPASPINRNVPAGPAGGSVQQSPVEISVTPTAPSESQALTGTATGRAEPGLTVAGPAPISTNTPAATTRPETPTASGASSTLFEMPEALELRQNNWGRALGHQLNWLVSHRMQEAEIRVNPPELGPLAIRLSLHHNQTNVAFFCHEAAVREAIENALPRLREMLDSQGITLNQAQVFDQSSARQQANSGEQSLQNPRNGRSPVFEQQDQEVAETIESQPRSSRSGGVDDYA